MNAIKNLPLSATILIASIILGSFYYASEVYKQSSIEKQLQIDSQAKAEQATQANTKLNDCLSQAQQDYLTWGAQLSKKADACTATGNGICRTADAFTEAFNKNDAQLQQDKNNCYVQYKQ
jgi:hypothetical protein